MYSAKTLLFYIYLLDLVLLGKSKHKIFGPYELNILKLQFCKSTTFPPEKNKTLFFSEEYDSVKKVIRGNITIVGDTTKYKGSISSYFVVNGVLTKRFAINNINCRTLFGSAVLSAIKIPFNKKTCAIGKGSYVFKDFDLNKFNHIVMSEWEYGQTGIRFEVTNGRRTAGCMEGIVDIVPETKVFF